MTDVDKKFPVVEIFGPTIQGEGALAGKVTHFVRFGGCDFACEWCDSDHAVLPQKVRLAPKLTADEIATRVTMLGEAPWVTLSGGNPALHDLTYLRDLLWKEDFNIAVETQGSKWQQWLGSVELLTISPKPPSSGMHNGFFDEFMGLSTDNDWRILKVPVLDERDLDFADYIHQSFPNVDFYVSVVTLMGGLYGTFAGGIKDTNDTLLERYHKVVDMVLARKSMQDVTVLPQLHALVWGHDRGH